MTAQKLKLFEDALTAAEDERAAHVRSLIAGIEARARQDRADWLEIGRFLLEGRRSCGNNPKAFGKWCAMHGIVLDAAVRSNAVWMAENWADLELADFQPGVNHPTAIRQAWRKLGDTVTLSAQVTTIGAGVRCNDYNETPAAVSSTALVPFGFYETHETHEADAAEVSKGQDALSRLKDKAAVSREQWYRVGRAVLKGCEIHEDAPGLVQWLTVNFPGLPVQQALDAGWFAASYADVQASDFPEEMDEPGMIREWCEARSD